MEMSGLGKMKPNLLLIGFKNNWQSSLTEARDYYKIIQTAFDMRLSVGVLRIPGINPVVLIKYTRIHSAILSDPFATLLMALNSNDRNSS